MKTSSGKDVAEPFPYLMVYIYWRLMSPLNLIFSHRVTHPFYKGRFRRTGASAVRASEKVQLSRIGSRLRAFERAIDEVSTIPLTPPKGGSKSEFVV